MTASLWLRITLQTDAAITDSSATVGPHESLGYLPGALLLGAVAAHDYPADDPVVAFRRFHSGAVRFGAALPVGADGGQTLPMPLSLHKPKGSDSDQATNLARGRDEAVQYKQCRTGFLDSLGKEHHPVLRASMRTAVGANGTARDGFLFTISALPAGSEFLSRIDADDPRDLDPVRGALLGREIRIGRSRSAEFGRATAIEVLNGPALGASESRGPAGGAALFLCVSDLALRTPEGTPAVTPEGAMFGLADGWTWDRERSFLRFRTYSPFNSHRGRPDLERQVIAAGSVIVFTSNLVAAPDPERVHRALHRGLGEYRAEGLGQVLFEPRLLSESSVRIEKHVAARAEAQPPADALVAWMREREDRRERNEHSLKDALRRAGELARYAVPAAQWGELRTFARRSSRMGNDEFIAALSTLIREPATPKDAGRSVRHDAFHWGRVLTVEGKEVKAADHLLKVARDFKYPAAALELLAIHVVRASKKKEERR